LLALGVFSVSECGVGLSATAVMARFAQLAETTTAMGAAVA
jgi:hypothetical protein